jgi:hypothetical protein
MRIRAEVSMVAKTAKTARGPRGEQRRGTASVARRPRSRSRERAGPADLDRPRTWQAPRTGEGALELPPGVFTLADPVAVARALGRAAEASARTRSDPYRGAMAVLTFYLNRSGRNVAARQRRVLERAKDELRRLYGRRTRAAGTRTT